MAQIVPKLNLNKTPSLVENNSLIFAKNIRLDVDGTIHRDYGIFPLSIPIGKNVNAYINYKTIINRIIADIKDGRQDNEYYSVIYDYLYNVVKYGKSNIVGFIASSNEFYLFISNHKSRIESSATRPASDCIIRYDEKEDKFYPCNCKWSYSGGTITGNVINNLLGEKILNIGESNGRTLVPFKSINLTTSNIYDDEKLYTQTPNIPIINLNYTSRFEYVIPNGVYQFFIRYKIRKDFYTDWFPASKELFAGNTNTISTSFGTAKYLNIHRDSDFSFKFHVNKLFPENDTNYESFQIGFIISHDDEIVARAWKHFDLKTEDINFDYNPRDAYEIEVIDLIKHTYQLYDVGNITSFKNKLYISNYKETDFNDSSLKTLANKIKIDIKTLPADKGYAGYTVNTTTIKGNEVISELKVNNKAYSFTGTNGIIHSLLTTNGDNYDYSFEDVIKDTLKVEQSNIDSFGSVLYDIYCLGQRTIIDNVKRNFKSKFPENKYREFVFDNEVQTIKVNGAVIPLIKNSDNTININSTVASIISTIYNKTRYLNTNAIFIDSVGNNANYVTIDIIRNCRYTYDNYIEDGLHQPDVDESIDPDGGWAGNNAYIESYRIEDTYTQTLTISFVANSFKFNIANISALLDNTTLIPYQSYKFYIHYVKQNGETTNGYYCDGVGAGIKTIGYQGTVDTIIYPSFSNITIPDGYVSCFFSILHVENNVGTLFDLDTTTNKGEGLCLDVNLGLIPGINNITVKQENNQDDTGKFHYSSDSSDIRYFGAYGVLTFGNNIIVKDTNKDVAYIVNQYKISEAEDTQLVKCTPFIKTSTFEDFVNMNLLGYICEVYPLNKQRTIDYYTDGSTVFLKEENTSIDSFKLVELKNHLGDTTDTKLKLTSMYLTSSNKTYIYSNYNLNYMTLIEEPVETYKTYYTGSSENTSSESGSSIILRLFKSLTMSSIYELPSMYKSYTRKTYSIINKNDITEFKNTIRSSYLEGDESSMNIFKFDANDYYNVPTNRGIITNLVAVGDAILVHTEDSMFKFTGSNTLQSSDGEIQPAETNVFDTGVSEVFGSDFGFAGLQNKEDSIITENGYIFFDRDSRIVYMYGGQGRITKISDSVEKLFRHKDIKKISFANDYYNNRFFMCVVFVDKQLVNENNAQILKEVLYPVTLSFNISENIKSFVSLHDFYYAKAFNTKTKCYFLTTDNTDVCTINKQYKGCYSKLKIGTDKTYPSKTAVQLLPTLAKDEPVGTSTLFDLNKYESIVDVIVNDNYEYTKTLNSVNWCSSEIQGEYTEINSDDIDTLKMAEDINATVPCKNMRIYTDTCMTPLNDFSKCSNNYSIEDSNSYKYPRFNQGHWTFNYFRNIQNANNNINPYVSDQNSLMEGKYFVIRFVFDNDFKLETLTLNYNNKHE